MMEVFLYPVNLTMKGVPCLVIGGGHVALRKVKRLLGEDAEVTVISPVLTEEMERLFREKRISWRKASYQPGDARGYHFVVTACGVRQVAEWVHEESLHDSFLYNAADFPSLGNCSLPAAFETGGIHFAVSTDGRSPAMAKYVKNWLKGQIPPSFGAWLDRVGDIREELKKEESHSRMREEFWHTVFDDRIMDLVISGKLDEAEERVRNAVSCFRSEP
ncbi:precorrin-2 dehydrogenase/sirohydrochlorin ferrochelatase family protein [Dialister sp.]|uniref:precorrin-2 dehydrogenase/sirohydrochlorin ferrochelatase family protein n=1 Tax=Dialister sp. TaxID=1955814 RepID=UPI003F0CEDDE